MITPFIQTEKFIVLWGYNHNYATKANCRKLHWIKPLIEGVSNADEVSLEILPNFSMNTKWRKEI